MSFLGRLRTGLRRTAVELRLNELPEVPRAEDGTPAAAAVPVETLDTIEELLI